MVSDPERLQAEIERRERQFAENPQGRAFAPLADVYRQAGRYEEAEALLLEGLKRHPNYLSAYLVLGRLYFDWGRHEAASAQFAKVLELDSQNLVALRALGDLAGERGLWEEARRWYERVLQIDPHYEEVREALARIPTVEAPRPGSPLAAAAGPEAAGPETDAGVPEVGPVAGYSRYGDEMLDAAAAAPAAPAAPESPEAPEAPAAPEAPTERLSGVEAATPAAPSLGEGASAAPAEARPLAGARHGAREEAAQFDFEAEDVASPVTETMAELYAEQGLYEDAIEVYRELLAARPSVTRFRQRIEELERLARERAMRGPPPLPTPDVPLARREEMPVSRGPEVPEPGDREGPVAEREPVPAGPWAGAPVAGAGAPTESEVELPEWLLEEPSPAEAPAAGPGVAGREPAASEPAGAGFAPAEPAGAAAEEVPLPDWLLDESPPAATAAPVAAQWERPAPETAEALPFAFERPAPQRAALRELDPFAGSFDEARALEEAAAAAGPDVGAVAVAEASAAAETIGGYVRRLLAAGRRIAPAVAARDAAAAPTPTAPTGVDFELIAPEDEHAPQAAEPAAGTGAAPGATGAGDASADDDLAQFQAWLRSLKR